MNKLVVALILTVSAGWVGIAHAAPEKDRAAPATTQQGVTADAPGATPQDSPVTSRDSAEAGKKDGEDKGKDKSKKDGKPKKEGKAVPYPLETCIVTDNKLGAMGDEVTMVYEGQEIKFCCKPCKKKFEKEPARYLPKLQPKEK